MANAPVTQVVITVQFASAIRVLNALEIAQLYSSFAAEYPVYEQLQAAGPMAYTLSQLDGSEPVDYELPTIPRLGFHSPNRERLVMIQHDRFSYGWQRTVPLGEQNNYPGFEEVLSGFSAELDRFNSAIEDITGAKPSLKVSEVAYVNTFLTRTSDGQRIPLSELYTFLRKPETPTNVNGYQHTWNERLTVAEGVLTVTVAGPLKIAEGIPASSFALTSTYLIATADRLLEEMLAVRARSGETFRRVTGAEETVQ